MENSRIFILNVLDTLREYSDEDHYLTQQDIISLLDKQNIICDRRSVSRAIKELIEYGYDIDSQPHHGYALFSRDFDKSEAEYLIHAIYSSKVITNNASKELVKKVEQGFSKYNRIDFSYLYKSGEISRTNNQEVFFNIDLIEESIIKNKMITFEYLTINENLVEEKKKKGKRYKVSPYYLFVNNGSFFLICNTFPYKDLYIYRVTNITNLLIDEENAVPLKNIDKNFEIEEYLNNHAFPFMDKVINAKFSFTSLGLVN